MGDRRRSGRGIGRERSERSVRTNKKSKKRRVVFFFTLDQVRQQPVVGLHLPLAKFKFKPRSK